MPAAAAPQVLLGNALQASGDRAGAASAMDDGGQAGPLPLRRSGPPKSICLLSQGEQ